MQRQMKLVLKLLLHAERKNDSRLVLPPEFDEYTVEQVNYHMGLCNEAGYMRVEKVSGSEEPYPRYAMGNLTWMGHEALDRLR